MKRCFALLILCTTALYTSQPPMDIAKQLGNRSLIILCDEAGIIGATTSALASAINEGCAPIITSNSLWKQTQRINGKTEGIPPLEIVSFNVIPDEWNIYATSDWKMLIFIPKQGILKQTHNAVIKFNDYLQKLDIFSADKKEILSDGELLLGMKLSQLQKINTISEIPGGERINDTTNLTKYLNEILITNKDLNLMPEGLLNQWDIYLEGHGFENKTAGMDIAAFKSFLDFLNRNVTTRSLFYVTCYAGDHLKDAYQIEVDKETKDKNFNFTIISGTALQAPMSATLPIPEKAYSSYFQLLGEYFKGGKKSNDKLFKAISTFKFFAGNSTIVDSIATVRFPNTQWFKIPGSKDAFVLNNDLIMRSINRGKKTISLKQDTVIIESQYVPITLDIYSTNKTKPILVPTKSDCFLQEIHLTHLTFLDFILSLVRTSQVLQSNLYIQKLVIKNNSPNESVQSRTFKNVIISKGNVILKNEKTNQWRPYRGNDKRSSKDEKMVGVSAYIALEENGKVYTLDPWKKETEVWEPGYLFDTSDDAIKALVRDFQEKKETIRKESTLPTSMTADTPKPTIEKPLSYEFLAYIGKPQELSTKLQSLEPEQKERLEKFINLIITSAILGHQYFLYKDDERQLTQWEKRLSKSDKERLKRVENLWKQYQANKDDEVKLTTWKSSLSRLDTTLLDYIIDADQALKDITRPEFFKKPYGERPLLERHGAYAAKIWRDVTRRMRGVDVQEREKQRDTKTKRFEKQQDEIALILLWREYLLRKENGLSFEDWKISTGQRDALNLMIPLWNDYQAKQSDAHTLNIWKSGLSEQKKDILELLIKITPEKK